MRDDSVIETLNAQQELLHKLYTELEMEREAAASAASESLSMIRRLQGEKAAVEMEACQYKRIAEEKIGHAEEALEVLRDLVFQKEMEIASLEFQTQAYRFKLISLGCSDGCENESTYSQSKLIKRRCSLPSRLFLAESECERTEDCSSYLEKITGLDGLVKQLSYSKDSSDNWDKPNTLSRSSSKDPATPGKVHDIFEVPQAPSDAEFADFPVASEGEDKGNEIYPVMPDGEFMDNPMPKSRAELGIEHLCDKHPGVTDFELEQLNSRLKRLEEERIMARQDVITPENGEETLRLMKAIEDQLNSIEHEMKRWRPKERPKKKQVDLTSLTEALLHFWA